MRVTVRNPFFAARARYAFPQREFFTFEGEQVDPPKGHEPGTIAITTGYESFPVRVIHPSDIVSIDDRTVETQVIGPRSREVQVQGSKGSVYTVTINRSGGRSCTCAGFQFRKSCRHIAEAA
jgi:hypothetical protein